MAKMVLIAFDQSYEFNIIIKSNNVNKIVSIYVDQ